MCQLGCDHYGIKLLAVSPFLCFLCLFWWRWFIVGNGGDSNELINLLAPFEPVTGIIKYGDVVVE